MGNLSEKILLKRISTNYYYMCKKYPNIFSWQRNMNQKHISWPFRMAVSKYKGDQLERKGKEPVHTVGRKF